jgi:hypothetical protein
MQDPKQGDREWVKLKTERIFAIIHHQSKNQHSISGANSMKCIITGCFFFLLTLIAQYTLYTGDINLTPLEVNRNQLVEMAVVGEISPPVLADPPYRVSPEGKVVATPATGSITYNFRTGDSAVDMAGDHVEPAVSIVNFGITRSRNSPENIALNTLSCVGNVVTVISGDAKGAKGTVVGKHGGIENVLVEFPDEVYGKLAVGDEMQVRAVGLGMEVTNIDDIYVMNLGPQLLDALTRQGMGVTTEGRLRVPVTHRIPAKIMGSGLGQRHVYSGDYDIQMFDEDVVRQYGLEMLRFGDIVAIMDADHRYGRIYRGGAVTIGVVVHGVSVLAGHGPGVTTLITSPGGNIETVIDSDANLAWLLGLR